MKTGTKYALWFGGGIVAGGLLAVVVPLVVLALGVMDMSATPPPGRIESVMAPWALNRSIASHAPNRDNPFKSVPSVLASGLNHYGANCVLCHGAPNVPAAELAQGLNPPVPALDAKATQSRTDGQLFWIVQNGIRMTGMPAFGPSHDTDEIWHIVAFVRHLPDLTNQERQALLSVVKEEGDHHDSHDGM